MEERLGAPIPGSLLAFMRIAYLAFQLGRSTMALQTSSEEEAGRLGAEIDFHRDKLTSRLGA